MMWKEGIFVIKYCNVKRQAGEAVVFSLSEWDEGEIGVYLLVTVSTAASLIYPFLFRFTDRCDR